MSMPPSGPYNPAAAAAAQRLTPRGKTSTFTFLSGLAMGALTIGLIMPFLVGQDPSDLVSDTAPTGDFSFDEAGSGDLPAPARRSARDGR